MYRVVLPALIAISGDILGSLGVRISNPWEKTAPNFFKKFLSWLETSKNDHSRGDGVRLQASLSSSPCTLLFPKNVLLFPELSFYFPKVPLCLSELLFSFAEVSFCYLLRASFSQNAFFQLIVLSLCSKKTTCSNLTARLNNKSLGVSKSALLYAYV